MGLQLHSLISDPFPQYGGVCDMVKKRRGRWATASPVFAITALPLKPETFPPETFTTPFLAMPTITYKGEARELPATLKNSALMRFEEAGGSFSAFSASPATQAVKLACAVLNLPGDPEQHADDLPALPELIEALSPLLSTYGAKKAPAAGPSISPVPGTPGA